jgi:hypothetical protein
MKLPICIAVVALAAAPALDVAAKCARTELVPVVLTKADTSMKMDGGVVVGWESSMDYDGPQDGDPSVQPKWTGQLAGKDIELTRTTLAPGLTLYAPASVLIGKQFALRDAKAKTLVTVTLASPKPKGPDAPKVTRVESVTRPGLRGDETDVTAYVAGVPDDAVALIVTAGKTATSFGRPAHDKQGATHVVVYASPGHCGSNPPGETAPAVGSKVTLTWVDNSGRRSDASSEVTVTAGKP